LEFAQERPEREKWEFEGKLFERRDSEIEEDKLFFEALREVRKKDLGRIKEIEERVREERGKIAENLKEYLLLTRAMEELFDGGRIVLAAKIAVVLAKSDPESARKAMERCFDEEQPDLAGKSLLL
jgi:hypothetical protein